MAQFCPVNLVWLLSTNTLNPHLCVKIVTCWATWDRRRPRYLFKGRTTCGVCGGGVTNLNAERMGCASARNNETCDNKWTIKRETLEATVLDGLQHHLMDPELMALFCEEYTRAGRTAERGYHERQSRAAKTDKQPGPLSGGQVKAIHLVPEEGHLQVHLVGKLAALLQLGLKEKPGLSDEAGLQVTLVAGARYRHCRALSVFNLTVI